MSLKGAMSSTELFDAVDDARKGKKEAIEKLKGLLPKELYDELVTQHIADKKQREKKLSRKIKATFFGTVAAIVLLCSMASTFGDLIVHHGKGIAVWYLLLWFWAFYYAFDKEPKSQRISELENENKTLKTENEMLKNRIYEYERENNNLKRN